MGSISDGQWVVRQKWCYHCNLIVLLLF